MLNSCFTNVCFCPKLKINEGPRVEKTHLSVHVVCLSVRQTDYRQTTQTDRQTTQIDRQTDRQTDLELSAPTLSKDGLTAVSSSPQPMEQLGYLIPVECAAAGGSHSNMNTDRSRGSRATNTLTCITAFYNPFERLV